MATPSDQETVPHPTLTAWLREARRILVFTGAVINRGPTDQDGLTTVGLRLEGDVDELFPPAVEAALS